MPEITGPKYPKYRKDRKNPKNNAGRPSTYTQAVADRVCEGLCKGLTLTAVCTQEGMPLPETVRKWAMDDICAFGNAYARAREVQAHHLAEEIMDLADNGLRNKVPSDILKLQIDARKWYSAHTVVRYSDRPGKGKEEGGDVHVTIYGGLPEVGKGGG